MSIPNSVKDEIEQIIKKNKEETMFIGGITNGTGKMTPRGGKKPEEIKVVCVSSPCKIYLINHSGTKVRSVASYHILDLVRIQSHTLSEVACTFKDGSTFTCDLEYGDDCLSAIFTEYKTHFAGLPQPYFQVDVEPESRADTTSDRTLICGGYVETYRALCKYHGIPVREDICWDLEHLVGEQGLKTLTISEFETPGPADVRAMLSALRYNTYFTGLNVSGVSGFSLGKDRAQLEGLLECMRGNTALVRLQAAGIGAKPDFFAALFRTMGENKGLGVSELDVSNNVLDGNAAAALGKWIEVNQHGVSALNLSACSLDKRSFPALGASLKRNPKLATSLSSLNLSYNRLEAEGSAALGNFLSLPNMLTELRLQDTQSSFETIIGAVARGCQELRRLDVAGSKIAPKAAQQLAQWVNGTSTLRELDISSTGVGAECFRDILASVGQNVYLEDITMRARSNAFGERGGAVFASALANLANLRSLDISANDLGDEGIAAVATALAKGCPRLIYLDLSENLSAKSKRTTGATQKGVKALISLLEAGEACPIECLQLRGSKATVPVVEDILALIADIGVNDTLEELNLSGNSLGNKGAVALGKMVQTNKALHTLVWDDNGTGPQGFQAFAVGLERNKTLKSMPLPVNDIAAVIAQGGSAATATSAAILDIQTLLARNQNPAKFACAAGGAGAGAGGLMVNMGQQQIVDDMVMRIKRVDVNKMLDANPDFTDAVEDAQRANKTAIAFQLAREEIQAQLQTEVAQKLSAFAEQMSELVGSMKSQMRSRLVEALEKSVRSLDADTVKRLGVAVEFGGKSFDKTTLDKILVTAAGAEIMSKAGECFASAVEVASDYMYEKLMDRLDDIFAEIVEVLEADVAADGAEDDHAKKPAATSSTPSSSSSHHHSSSKKEEKKEEKKDEHKHHISSKPKAPAPVPAGSAAPSRAPPMPQRAAPIPAKPASGAPKPPVPGKPPVAGKPAGGDKPVSLADKKALLAGVLGGGPRPRMQREKVSDMESGMDTGSMMSMPMDMKPVKTSHKVMEPPKKGEANSVLAKVETNTEAEGPALTHMTKGRAKPPAKSGGRGAKGGRRPPTRNPRTARPLAPSGSSK